MSEPLVTRDQIYAVLTQEEQTAAKNAIIDDHILQTHSRIEIELGFSYERDVQVRRLSATDDPVLTLPGPGVASITSLTENGIALEEGTDYEIDPDNRRYLIRLDSTNQPQDWTAGRRNIVITYVSVQAPNALVAAERVETVRAFRGAQAGYADRIGVDGESSIPYTAAFTPDTRRLLEALKKGDGIGVW